ncbi:formimidoylglutamate deiminase [Nonomuraea guangzhouensis]|uniref:Formimidoylglutamate deiminase n=2 Tax=Nonomuraea guangzhouensis TaxID=1291555 RepID=A0ABW4G2H6_9ACTN
MNGRFWARYAWTGAMESGVLIEVSGGRIASLQADSAPGDAVVLDGLVIPGLANAHSHAFHRALRGATQLGGGTFWTWRETMYRVAAALTPDEYLELARAVYAEMALAGITCVGEFHYLHHAPGGVTYDDPNAMGEALIEAAAQAGIRITLLDTCYLSSGFGAPPDETQLRFSDGSGEAWAERVSGLKERDHARVGAAVHSVRAVPADQLGVIGAWAAQRNAPIHAHVSEQPAENEGCLAAYGVTPTRLLADRGLLGPRTTAVHATHLTSEDIALLGGSATTVCMCPTTERDLADGIGPAREVQDAGSPLSLGSDSQAVIDLFEEARAMELNERLRTRRRGHWTADALLRAATVDGHASLGWPEAGTLEVGALADLVTISLDSVRTAGSLGSVRTAGSFDSGRTAGPLHGAETAVFAATSADVSDVVAGGRVIVRRGVHQLVPDVAGALRQALARVAS